jgi:uncharacterized protein
MVLEKISVIINLNIGWNIIMKKTLLNALLIATALSVSALSPLSSTHALAQDAAPKAMDELAPKKAEAEQVKDVDPALWVVKDADTTLYLFGTVHVLKPNLGWFDDGVKTAFDSSDQLVIEMVEPPAEKMQDLFMKLAIDKSGKTLRSKLDGKERALYEGMMTKLGIPVAQFDPYEPWAAGLTTQVIALMKEGYTPGNGAEMILISAAKKAKKPITGLETAEYQLGLLDSVPEGSQIKFLIDGAKDIDKGNETISKMIEAWGKGDPETLASIMNENMTEPELYEKLLTQRNANWAQWINKRMEKPGTVFIAVGAGHLSGTSSVPELLSAYKIKAERVNY